MPESLVNHNNAGESGPSPRPARAETRAIVLTSNFPFGKGEEFFETELAFLSRRFDRVVILSRNHRDPQTRSVPQNVGVRRIPKMGFRGKLGQLAVPFLPEFWREIGFLKGEGAGRLRIGVVRKLISFITHGLNARREILRLLLDCGAVGRETSVVIYAYWMEFPVYGALSLKRAFPALKVVSRAHGCDLYWERQEFNYLPLRNHIAENIDAAYFISQQGRNYFIAQNKIADQGKFKVARLGVRGADVPAQASRDGVFRILTCAFVAPVKRLDLLVKALARVESYAVEWTHIGDGGQLPELQAAAASLSREHPNIQCVFKGYLTNEQVYHYYRSARVDLLVNLSSTEGVPVSIMEALAFGVPILATAVGGVPEIVGDQNGLLLPADVTEEQVAAAIARMRGLPESEVGALKHRARDTWRRLYNAEVNYNNFAEDVLELLDPGRKEAAVPGTRAGAELLARGGGS